MLEESGEEEAISDNVLACDHLHKKTTRGRSLCSSRLPLLRAPHAKAPGQAMDTSDRVQGVPGCWAPRVVMQSQRWHLLAGSQPHPQLLWVSHMRVVTSWDGHALRCYPVLLGSAEKSKEHELMGEDRIRGARDPSGHPAPREWAHEWRTIPAGGHSARAPVAPPHQDRQASWLFNKRLSTLFCLLDNLAMDFSKGH